MIDAAGTTPPDAEPLPRTRRAVVRELGAVSLVLAVPAVAVFLTATPIPNPPSREILNLMSPARLEVLEQRRQAAAARRRAAIKRSRDGDVNEQERLARKAERRANRP